MKDFIRAPEVGKKQISLFINNRLKNGTVNFFTPITRNNLLTGIQKKPKTKKAIEVLKEDCQAFGTIIAKAYTLKEAFGYPIEVETRPKRRYTRKLKKAKERVQPTAMEDVGDETIFTGIDEGMEGDEDTDNIICEQEEEVDDDSNWEVSDFMSSDDSCDEWVP